MKQQGTKKEIYLENLKNDYHILKDAPKEYFKDSEFCKSCLYINPLSIYYMPKKYSEDIDIMLYVCELDKSCFNAASKKLKLNPSFYLKLVKFEPSIMEYNIYRKKEIYISALRVNSAVIENIELKVASNWWPEITDAYLDGGGIDVRYVKPNITPEQAIRFLKKTKFAWDHLLIELQQNIDVICQALKAKENNENIDINVCNTLGILISSDKISAKQFLNIYDGEITKIIYQKLLLDKNIIELDKKYQLDLINVTENYREHLNLLFLKNKLNSNEDNKEKREIKKRPKI